MSATRKSNSASVASASPSPSRLFTIDKAVAPAGAALAGITLPDAVFEPVLEHLLLIETPEGPLGPV